MTIIEPNKNSFQSKVRLWLILGLVLGSVVLGIFLYSTSVQLSYNLEIKMKSIAEARAENAELKNNLYVLMDFENADELAQKLGLIKERRPEYLALKSNDQ